MSSIEPIIEVRDLVAGYGEHIVLDGISFDVYPGEILVVLGGSGCGKTTLLKHMVGLIRPFSGSVRYWGRDITEMDEVELDKLLHRIGISFQTSRTFSPISSNTPFLGGKGLTGSSKLLRIRLMKSATLPPAPWRDTSTPPFRADRTVLASQAPPRLSICSRPARSMDIFLLPSAAILETSSRRRSPSLSVSSPDTRTSGVLRTRTTEEESPI